MIYNLTNWCHPEEDRFGIWFPLRFLPQVCIWISQDIFVTMFTVKDFIQIKQNLTELL